MQILWDFLPFQGLSADRLYAILQLRNEVFVVEQKILYQDADGLDQKAFHLMGSMNGQLALYARIFPPNHLYHGENFPATRIGRVAVKNDFRGKGLGHSLMKESLSRISKSFGKAPVILNAQAHLEKFYNVHGFIREGAEFIEEEIPHVFMQRKAP